MSTRRSSSVRIPEAALRFTLATTLIALALVIIGCSAHERTRVVKIQVTNTDQRSPQETYIGGYVNPDVFTREIIATDDSGHYLQIGDMRFRVNSLKTFGYLGSQWPWGTLPYKLDPSVRADTFKVSQFAAACTLLTSTTGVGCIDSDLNNVIDANNYVYVVNDSSNHSYVGRGGGRQLLGIASWGNQIIIAHEIMHALGWVHEQSRPDRDQYVKINRENIQAGEERDFDIIGGTTKPAYNFDSIMHYGPFAFSKNRKMTIEPLPAYQNHLNEMGQRTHISPIDIEGISGVYGQAHTEWCGLSIAPKVPAGCFLECTWSGNNPTYGTWWICGGCPEAQFCP